MLDIAAYRLGLYVPVFSALQPCEVPLLLFLPSTHASCLQSALPPVVQASEGRHESSRRSKGVHHDNFGTGVGAGAKKRRGKHMAFAGQVATQVSGPEESKYRHSLCIKVPSSRYHAVLVLFRPLTKVPLMELCLMCHLAVHPLSWP